MPGKPRSAVVLVIDRLGAGFLGPYGNTWLPTPQFNRLASQAQLFEWCLADAPQLDRVYRSYWTGLHALSEARSLPGPDPLPDAVRAAGLRSVLWTDDEQVARLPSSSSFDEKVLISPSSETGAAGSLEETGMGSLFLSAADMLAKINEPVLLWVHSLGMAGPWDAPYSLRQQFADEDDPPPPDFVQPPHYQLPPQHNPDELLGLMHAYAGQVAVLDACLGAVLDALDEHPRGEEMLLAVTSPRGYPLGEHGWVGASDALYGELLHVPLIVRTPETKQESSRVTDLVQPADLYRALGHWLGISTPAPSEAGTACAVATGQRAIRTPAWFLREIQDAHEPRYELFTKPDDRWEVNQVASRAGDVVELMAERLRQFERAAAAGEPSALPPIPASLKELWR